MVVLRVGSLLSLVVVLAACNWGGQSAGTSTTVELANPSPTATTMPTVTSTTTAPRPTGRSNTTTTSLPTATNPPTTKAPAPTGNRPPNVEIVSPVHLSSHEAAFDTVSGRFGATVALEATVSDPDGDAFSVDWISSDEGHLGTGESITSIIHTGDFDAAQPRLTARATDQWGAVGEATIQIIVVIPSDA